MSKKAVISIHKSAGDSAVTIRCDPENMVELVDEALHLYAQLPDHTMIGDAAGMRVFPGLSFQLPEELRLAEPPPDED